MRKVSQNGEGDKPRFETREVIELPLDMNGHCEVIELPLDMNGHPLAIIVNQFAPELPVPKENPAALAQLMLNALGQQFRQAERLAILKELQVVTVGCTINPQQMERLLAWQGGAKAYADAASAMIQRRQQMDAPGGPPPQEPPQPPPQPRVVR